LEDLRDRVGIPGLYYAGVGGLELDLRGRWVTHPEAEVYDVMIQSVTRRLRELAAQHRGAWVESKRLGLTLHYRQVARHQLDELLARADEALGSYADQLRKVPGEMAWEVTPALGWDKGSALRLITRTIGEPVLPLYAGDGANDAVALVTAAALGGISLGVGAAAPSEAQHRLHDPAALVDFLTCLAALLADASTNPGEGRAS
jgi:trehalose-phosphatase